VLRRHSAGEDEGEVGVDFSSLAKRDRDSEKPLFEICPTVRLPKPPVRWRATIPKHRHQLSIPRKSSIHRGTAA
jgi:hypothetical protein